MRPKDRELAQQLKNGLLAFSERRQMPGINDPDATDVLIDQILDSIHRVQYISVIRTRRLSECVADPEDQRFDPLKAAILRQSQGDLDEAFWLIFLFIHFGKHAKAGWRYAREIYGRLGAASHWDWKSVSVDTAGFRRWLHASQGQLKRDGVPRGFGNHRKYESLDAYSESGTGTVIESYVNWIHPPRTHKDVMEAACERAGGDPHKAFDDLYRSMTSVQKFGRIARFEYLAMVGKLGLAHIEPGSPYLQGATGPLSGARLLFGGNKEVKSLKAKKLNGWMIELGAELNVGMQVLEDALCNWQKSPREFKSFRG